MERLLRRKCVCHLREQWRCHPWRCDQRLVLLRSHHRGRFQAGEQRVERHRPGPDRGRYEGSVRVSDPNTQQCLSISTNQVQSSNEPDNPSEANLTPSQSVTIYQTFMQPYYGTVQLGTPAVTNGGGQAGLTYLENFISLCTGCTYNFINIHYLVDRSDMDVTSYIQAFKDYIDITVPSVQAKHDSLTGLPIAVGEVRIHHPPSLPHNHLHTSTRLTSLPSSGSPAPQKTKPPT